MPEYDLAFIQSKIPHRPPMLLIDSIVELGENSIVCRKTFRSEEFFFQGHYPSQPIVPGFILCECAAQAGAILAATGPSTASGIPVLTRANEIRFKQVVRPGDSISIGVEREDQLGNATFFSAVIKLNDKVAATMRFAAMIKGSD